MYFYTILSHIESDGTTPTVKTIFNHSSVFSNSPELSPALTRPIKICPKILGYLATVSTVEEDAFIYRCSNEIGWLGGTKMTHGAADTKNGIPFYKTFTPSGNGDGIGYWYWAVGPDVNEGGGKFLQSPTAASNSVLQTADSKGYYNNWNSGEPNNSNGEFAMTTLKIGSGWSI